MRTTAGGPARGRVRRGVMNGHAQSNSHIRTNHSPFFWFPLFNPSFSIYVSGAVDGESDKEYGTYFRQN